MSGLHPSHVTRSSDSSLYDERCTLCGATDHVPGGWGRLALPCPVAEPIEAAMADEALADDALADDAAIDAFAVALKAKMAATRAKGRAGWRTTPTYQLRDAIVGNTDPVDVAIYCMMLHSQGAKID